MIKSNMDKKIEGMKFFDDILTKKGKMTTKEFTAHRKALRGKYQEEMNKLATKYAVRNSKYHVGDNVKVCDYLWINEPCIIQQVIGRYDIMQETGTPVIVYAIKLNRDGKTYEVMEKSINGKQ